MTVTAIPFTAHLICMSAEFVLPFPSSSILMMSGDEGKRGTPIVGHAVDPFLSCKVIANRVRDAYSGDDDVIQVNG